MFSKIGRVIRFSLLGFAGFGISGAILGYIHTTENSWLWLLGFTAIGIVSGGTLGFILGGSRTARNLTMFGAIAGVLGGYLISNSDYDPWLKIIIISIVFGIGIGFAFTQLDLGDRRSSGKALYCSECESQIGKDDNYCPNCGLEFE